MASSSSSSSWSGLLPKAETQAEDFIKENPSFDGRGIIVGILDTGVDPGAIGLSMTSDGKPKVIDSIDCSGSGDVSMSPFITIPEGTYTIQSNGKGLLLNPNWKNPSRQYRVGIKRAFELYPRGLTGRVKEERKKIFSIAHKNIELQLQNELNTLQSSSSSQQETIDDVKARIAQLRLTEKEDDPGPVYDCIVWFDGEYWQAVVDTTETGDMSSALPMTDYRHFLQYSRFSAIDALNYCVNIYDEGATLSIVVDAGAHGSHVAGIVSAYHPNQPELNGIAPGAQIISLKIGDTRLGSMETGVGLTRAMIEAVRRKCDIINMSYGEATSWDNQGSFAKLAKQIVHKHGIIFVSSAGNNGPALSTVGCPGGTTSCAIGVGALATESLMGVAYSMQEILPATNYTWSSMGPTLDGDIGVSIIAPGGAVTSVPNWTLNRNQLMNGTSMSSPNATGCISLLLSAGKSLNMPLTPVHVRRAVENSAKFIEGVEILGQGHGILQVKAAWDLLLKNPSPTSLTLPSSSLSSSSSSPPSSSSSSSSSNAAIVDDWSNVSYSLNFNSERFVRGIYLRQPIESSTANTYKVQIDPQFHDDTPADVKVRYEVRIRFESTADWIKGPENALIAQAGKTVSVSVDPRSLPAGSVNVGMLKAYDDNNPASSSLGPLFEIPVTVVVPEVIPDFSSTLSLGEIRLAAAERYRRFIVPPKGCTFVDIVVTDTRSETNMITNVNVGDEDIDSGADVTSSDNNSGDGSVKIIAVHALQIFRGTPYRDNEKDTYISLMPKSTHVMSWSVHEGITMEVVIARNWNTIGDTVCNVDLHFRGVTPSPKGANVIITGGQKVSDLIRVHALLSKVDISPSASLTKWISVLKPSSLGKVLTLGERDILPCGTPLYQLILEYEFENVDSVDIIPRWPGLQGILYESDFHAQFFMIYDSKKKLVGTGDAWPKGIKIGKGKYIIRIQIRHSSVVKLESIADLPVYLERALKNSINLTFYKTKPDAFVGNEKMNKRSITLGGNVSMYIREPTFDSLPKAANAGDFLTGTVTYMKKDPSVLGSGIEPNGYPIKYIIADTKSPAPASAASSSKDSKSTSEKEKEKEKEKEESGLDTAIKEAKIKYLKSQVGTTNDAFCTLYGTIETEYPDNLQVRQTMLSHAIKLKVTSSNVSIQNVINAANSVISIIDQNSLAMELGVNVDKDNAGAVAQRKEMENKKSSLIEALSVKAFALLDWIQFEKSNQQVNVPDDSSSSSSSSSSTSTSISSDSGNNGDSDAAAAAATATATATTTIEMEFEFACKEIMKWDDITSDKHWLLFVSRMKHKGKLGIALKRVVDLISANADNKPSKSGSDVVSREQLYEEKQAILEQLKWDHLVLLIKSWKRFASKDYDPF